MMSMTANAAPLRRALHLALAPLALSRGARAGRAGAGAAASIGVHAAAAAGIPACGASPGGARRPFGSTSSASAGGAGAGGAPAQPPPALSAAASHPSGLTLFSGSGAGLGLGVPPSYAPLYRPSPLNLFIQRYYYLFRGAGAFSRRASVGLHSEAIYRSVEEQATQEGWWDTLGLPRTWIAEHAMIALHVWMFHCRFKVDYNVGGEFNGRRMQEQLFERLWEDTTIRIRNAGIAEISVNKQLEGVQKITFDDMFGYDAAIKSLEDDNMELAGALWKGVFREDEAANSEAVLRLADYVRRETLALLLAPREDVYRGWVSWGPIVGETPGGRLERQARMLAGEWREALHPDGRVFFYHTATHEVRWEPPAGGLYTRRRFALRQLLAAAPGGGGKGALPPTAGGGGAQPPPAAIEGPRAAASVA